MSVASVRTDKDAHRRRVIAVAIRLAAPLALAASFLVLRDGWIGLFERIFGLEFMFGAIELVSMADLRAALFAAAAAGLAIAAAIAQRAFGARRADAIIALILLVGVILALARWTPRGAGYAALAIPFLYYLNARARALPDAFFWGAPVIAEALFPGRYGAFVARRLPGARRFKIEDRAIAIVQAAALIALCAPFTPLATVWQNTLRSPGVEAVLGPKFTRVTPYDVTGVALDAARRRLLVCGGSLQTIIALDLATSPPAHRSTEIPTGNSQFCRYDPQTDRIFVHEAKDNAFIIADGGDYSILARTALDPLPAGEAFVDYNPAADVFVIASETLDEAGEETSVRILAGDGGRVIGAIDDRPGYMITNPDAPIVYFSYFFRDQGVRAYDLGTGALLGEAFEIKRGDRLLIDRRRGELLAASPVFGEVLLYDAASLALKSSFRAISGARAMAIDAENDLLLISSLHRNEVGVIDLATRRLLRVYRVGPWLRDIVIDSAEGAAYVTSRYGVYRVRYLEGAAARN